MPLYGAKRLECGMLPTKCGFFDHGECLRRIGTDDAVLKQVAEKNRELYYKEIGSSAIDTDQVPVICGNE